MAIQFSTSTYEAVRTGTTLVVNLTRTGTATTAASANVLMTPSTDYYPSGDEYQGIKGIVTWAIGETGNKSVTFNLKPSSSPVEYVNLSLDNIFPITEGIGIPAKARLAIKAGTASADFIPTTAGTYVRVAVVDGNGQYERVDYLPYAGSGGAGTSGSIENVSNPGGNIDIVPLYGLTSAGNNTTKTITIGLPLGTNPNQILQWNGTVWVPASLPQTIAATIDGVSNPNGNIDVTGSNGITVVGNNTTKVINVALPPGSANNQVLTWNGTTYVPMAIPTQTFNFSIEGVSNPNGNIDLVPGLGIAIVGNNTAKNIDIGLKPGTAAGQVMQWDGTDWTLAPLTASSSATIEGVSNPGGNIDVIGTQGVSVLGNDSTNTITIGLPPGTAPNQILQWNGTTYAPGLLPVSTIEGVGNPGGNVDIIPLHGLSVVGNNAAKTITLGLPVGTTAGQFLMWNGTAYAPAPLPVSTIENVSNPGGNIDLIGQFGIVITGNDTANTINIGLPAGVTDNDVLTWDGSNWVSEPASLAGLVSVEGVANTGGNIDLIANSPINITADDTANTITFKLIDGTAGSQQMLKWNGSGWVLAPAPILSLGGANPNPTGVVSVAGSNGITATPTGNTLNLALPAGTTNGQIMTYDGTAWIAAPAPTTQNPPPAGLLSIKGVSNPGGNVDLIPLGGLTIAADDAANTVTIGLPVGTADNQVLVWDGTNWVPAPVPMPTDQNPPPSGLLSVDGVSNPGGNIDLIPQGAISIVPNDTANTIAFKLIDGTAGSQQMLKWNGTAWTVAPAPLIAIGTNNGTATPNPSGIIGLLTANGLTASATANNVTVGLPAGTTAGDILTWDGTTYRPTAPSDSNAPFVGTFTGDGTTTTFSINHNQQSRYPSVQFFDAAGNSIEIDWQSISPNFIIVRPGVAIENGVVITVSVRK